MNINILHLNIERREHLGQVRKLLVDKNPDIACFVEIMEEDAKELSSFFNYNFIFSPRLWIEENGVREREGTAIFSKYKFLEISNYNYGENTGELPVAFSDSIKTNNGKRPSERFLQHSVLLNTEIQIKNKKLNIACTHFPVVDYNISGRQDRDFEDIENIINILRVRSYLDRLKNFLRLLPDPVLFTADLNSPKGGFIYDDIAHELVDLVPNNLESSLDPVLHRRPDLRFMVDTIMSSQSINAKSFEIIEGVSDHKAFLVSIDF